MASPLRFALARNVVSLVGIWLTTVSALLFLTVFLLDLLGFYTNPYIGIVFFLILPGFFILGLLFMPVGLWLERRRERRGLPARAAQWPTCDLNDPRQRVIALFVAAATVANIVIVSLATYRGVEYMDSVEFCGQVCHQVMRPEFTAYRDSPHARVACVNCHIGPGAPWFVRSKLSGTRQVFAVTFNTFPRPIPSPVMNLRPARETCEQCHWPEKFTGDMVVVFREYASDETNTESVTTLRVHVGGGSEKLGVASGIHWHMDPSNRITYITTDPKRQVIPYVRVEDRFGKVREYRAEGVTQAQLDSGERRLMDCMDCHNRPSHPFVPTAEEAVDEAMALGRISRDLPFVKRESVDLLKGRYTSQDAAASMIQTRLDGFYREQSPQLYAQRRQDVDRAITATTNIYRRNVFPDMGITWGIYANNIGHADFPGCFRCHDDSHTAKDGSAIKQDCDLCHQMEENAAAK